MKEVYCKIYVDGKEHHTITDPTEVYKDLADSLISKKINHCTYITRITRTQLYTGYINITVNYDNGVKRVFHVLDR